MLKRVSVIFSYWIVLAGCLSAQETSYGPGFQTLPGSNPALAGAEADGTLRLSYLNFYPGHGYNLHSVFASYDSYFQVLHGGAGLWISDDYLGGIVNDMRGGLSYAYHLQAGEDFFINAGLSASAYRRGFNFGNAVLPDQIDPFGGVSLPSAETLADRGKTVFDVGSGFLFIYKNLFAGLALSHLAEPELSPGTDAGRLQRKLLIHAAGEISLDRERNILLKPLGYAEFQGSHLLAAAGTTFELNRFSLNALLLGDNARNINVQGGFSMKTGKLSFFYTYRLNVVSGNNLLPLSLLHQTGLALVLNPVEKRNNTGTINLPEL